MLKNTERENRI